MQTRVTWIERTVPVHCQPPAKATNTHRRPVSIRDYPVYYALLIFCVSAALALVAAEAGHFFLLQEGGYGDVYVLHGVQQLQDTGRIYQDTSQPPYVPTVYSPAVYMLLSLPGRFIRSGNPFFLPRVLELISFLLCAILTASIARSLIPTRYAWFWGIALACSFAAVQGKVLMLRGDFPGLVFSLLAIRLLLSRIGYAPMLAGIAAGLAMHFKFTFVAALSAGFLWLLARRRWRDCATFSIAGCTMCLGGYFFFAVREPRMLSQILTFRHPLTDYPGLFAIITKVLHEPVLLLGVTALPLVFGRRWSRWRLLITFLASSFAVAAITDVQAGGAINYFYEACFAVTPFAVYSALRLSARPLPIAGIFIALLVLAGPAESNLRSAYHSARYEGNRVAKVNGEILAIGEVVRDKQVFSTVPILAMHGARPILTEPFLLSYLEKLGELDARPLAQRIRSQEFDAAITFADDFSYRGVALSPLLLASVAESYQRYCEYGGMIFYLPRQSPLGTLADRLRGVGCLPEAGQKYLGGSRSADHSNLQ